MFRVISLLQETEQLYPGLSPCPSPAAVTGMALASFNFPASEPWLCLSPVTHCCGSTGQRDTRLTRGQCQQWYPKPGHAHAGCWGHWFFKWAGVTCSRLLKQNHLRSSCAPDRE